MEHHTWSAQSMGSAEHIHWGSQSSYDMQMKQWVMPQQHMHGDQKHGWMAYSQQAQHYGMDSYEQANRAWSINVATQQETGEQMRRVSAMALQQHEAMEASTESKRRNIELASQLATAEQQRRVSEMMTDTQNTLLEEAEERKRNQMLVIQQEEQERSRRMQRPASSSSSPTPINFPTYSAAPPVLPAASQQQQSSSQSSAEAKPEKEGKQKLKPYKARKNKKKVPAANPMETSKLRRKIRKSSREKQRRMEINQKFEKLCKILHLGPAGRVKAEKLTILSETIDIISALRLENAELRAARAKGGEPPLPSSLASASLASKRRLSTSSDDNDKDEKSDEKEEDDDNEDGPTAADAPGSPDSDSDSPANSPVPRNHEERGSSAPSCPSPLDLEHSGTGQSSHSSQGGPSTRTRSALASASQAPVLTDRKTRSSPAPAPFLTAPPVLPQLAPLPINTAIVKTEAPTPSASSVSTTLYPSVKQEVADPVYSPSARFSQITIDPHAKPSYPAASTPSSYPSSLSSTPSSSVASSLASSPYAYLPTDLDAAMAFGEMDMTRFRPHHSEQGPIIMTRMSSPMPIHAPQNLAQLDALELPASWSSNAIDLTVDTDSFFSSMEDEH